MSYHRSPSRLTLLILISIGALSGCTGCNEPTKLPPNPVQLGLNIYLDHHAQEANVNENVYLGGRLNNNLGVAQDGVTVSFSLQPDSVGSVTAFAVTTTDTAVSRTGFATTVTFIGRRPGVAVITGLVVVGGEMLGRDTLSIRVRDPING